MKIYYKLKFWITCVLWPIVARRTMWKFTMKPVVGKGEVELTVGEE